MEHEGHERGYERHERAARPGDQAGSGGGRAAQEEAGVLAEQAQWAEQIVEREEGIRQVGSYEINAGQCKKAIKGIIELIWKVFLGTEPEGELGHRRERRLVCFE